MNGDGFTDWVYATKSGDQYKVFVMYGNGISMSSAQQVFSFSIAQSIFDNMMKPAGMEVLKLVDINGDGKTDFLFFEVNTQRAVWSARLNQFNGTSITTDYYSAISTDIAIALHDFNGNGLPDLLTHNGIRYNTSKEYSYSGTSLFGQLNAVCYRKPGVSDPINTQCGSTRMNFGFALTTSQAYDLNHDGLNDLVIEAQDKAVYLPNTYWAVFDAKINDANQLEFMLRDTLGGEQTIGNDLKKLYVLDMNNDGQSDYLYHDYNRWHIAYNSQSVPKIQTLALSQQLPNPDDMHFMQFLDLTGSGVPDIVYYHNGWKMLTYPFTSGPISVAGPTINTTTDSAQFVDMRGNGKPALVVTDFVNKRIRWFDFGVETETYPPCYPHCLPCTVGPCDNIQAQHMLLDEMSQIQSNPSVSNSLQDKIKAFTTGHQLTTSISYGFLNNTALQDEPYQNQSFTSTPGSYVFKLNGAIPVVSKVLSDTGQGITGVAYQYGEAFVQSGGRGFLGFSSLVTVDLQSGVKTRTRYRLGFPYIGLPMTTEQWSGNVLLSESRNVYSQLPLNGSKTVFPYAHASFEDNYQLNTNNTSTLISQIKTEQQYVAVSDSYVELREMRVYTKDVVHNIMRQVLTVNSYQQDNLSRWLINRLTRSTVTHQQGTGSISLGVASINPDPTKTVVRTSTFSYNGNGQLVEEVIEPEGNNEVYLKTVHSYDAVGNRTDSTVCSKHYITNCGVSAQQNLGERIYRSSTVLFDNDRRYVTSLVQNGVEVAKYSNFNALGQAQSVTENGIVSIRRFNAFGQPVFERTQTIAGAATGQYRIIRRSYIRSAVNLPANAPSGVWYEQVEQGGEPLSWSVYDAAGRVLASITQGFNSGEFRFQLAQYDELGRVTHQSQPGDNPSSLHWNVTEFDNLSRIKQVTAADGTLTSFNYSGASTTQTVTNFWANAIGQSKTTTKNAFGELLRVVDAAGTLRYEYDAAGNLLKATGVDSHSMVQAYNSRGFKKSMQDPDSGNWLYSYNALGELISQTDPRNHITLSYYDAFGRKYNEEIRHGQSLLRSVSWGFSDGIHAVRGLLTSETVTGAEAVNISKLFDYDSFGRLKDSVMFIDGETLTESFTYDQFGRVFQQFDASGDNFGQQFEYQNGYVKAIWEARYGRSSPNSVRYQLFEAMDAYGNVTQSRAGNGRSHWRSYDTKTGLINSITTSGQLQQWTYQFDGLGNLRNRKDALHRMRAAKYPYQMQTLDEYFEYDMLNRLTEVRLGSITSLWLEYANNGNIRYKSDVRWDAGFGGTLPPSDPPEDGISPPPEEGTWTLMGTTEFSRSASEYKYGIRPNQCNRTAGPRAVSQIGTQSYCYDTMGNQTRQYSDGTLVRQIDYGAIGKPSRIRSYNTDVANNSSPGDSFYTYDGSRNLVKRHVTEQGSTKIFYQHGGVELIIEGSERRFRRTFANAIVERSGNSITTSYVYTDHLGSVDVITNAAGQLLEKLSFDAFGKRRQVYTAAHVPVALSLASILNKTSRGFTGHLQVDHASIVHMGGRIYDSHIGRFLQADPFVQSPSNSQNFNRYSYVLNNPLSYTDPSGYLFKKLWKEIKPFVGAIVAVVGTIVCPACSPMLIGALAGAAGAAANGGNILKGAVMGAFSAHTFGAVGQQWAAGTFANVMGNAVAGGLMNSLQGGKFGHGFWAAGFSASFKPGINKIGGGEAAFAGHRIAAAAVIGGTASKISGGKFANGAVTGAFSQAFNGEEQLKRENAQYWSRVERAARYEIKRLDGMDLNTEAGREAFKTYLRLHGWSGSLHATPIDPEFNQLSRMKLGLRSDFVALAADAQSYIVRGTAAPSSSSNIATGATVGSSTASDIGGTLGRTSSKILGPVGNLLGLHSYTSQLHSGPVNYSLTMSCVGTSCGLDDIWIGK
ncbi:Integrins alpha chain [Alishewanella jeotgali KCTC 22429]|uniref:Integrins alpha chain n=2 Tax=Alishewanella jeotgali TaxID=545533 RepID=H3ZH42_9ALTE|nr:Integrins alpha chain [Alishewanella jeotgali KCTC 22429]